MPCRCAQYCILKNKENILLEIFELRLTTGMSCVGVCPWIQLTFQSFLVILSWTDAMGCQMPRKQMEWMAFVCFHSAASSLPLAFLQVRSTPHGPLSSFLTCFPGAQQKLNQTFSNSELYQPVISLRSCGGRGEVGRGDNTISIYCSLCHGKKWATELWQWVLCKLDVQELTENAVISRPSFCSPEKQKEMP